MQRFSSVNHPRGDDSIAVDLLMTHCGGGCAATARFLGNTPFSLAFVMSPIALVISVPKPYEQRLPGRNYASVEKGLPGDFTRTGEALRLLFPSGLQQALIGNDVSSGRFLVVVPTDANEALRYLPSSSPADGGAASEPQRLVTVVFDYGTQNRGATTKIDLLVSRAPMNGADLLNPFLQPRTPIPAASDPRELKPETAAVGDDAGAAAAPSAIERRRHTTAALDHAAMATKLSNVNSRKRSERPADGSTVAAEPQGMAATSEAVASPLAAAPTRQGDACKYCHSADHLSRQCPRRGGGAARSQPVPVRAPSPEAPAVATRAPPLVAVKVEPLLMDDLVPPPPVTRLISRPMAPVSLVVRTGDSCKYCASSAHLSRQCPSKTGSVKPKAQ